ncbi:hypothetical protein H0G86_005675 [Trichoderma simmonsii]|uniref:Uncharacterized protein n=1 Tax=Trichoderma simmonsii TaxID=1491479 RepID=A0A8G0LF22_9HYPO|nr:hypothetical protein H0G86_005675 [Trichoderma simmonsii]
MIHFYHTLLASLRRKPYFYTYTFVRGGHRTIQGKSSSGYDCIFKPSVLVSTCNIILMIIIFYISGRHFSISLQFLHHDKKFDRGSNSEEEFSDMILFVLARMADY